MMYQDAGKRRLCRFISRFSITDTTGLNYTIVLKGEMEKKQRAISK